VALGKGKQKALGKGRQKALKKGKQKALRKGRTSKAAAPAAPTVGSPALPHHQAKAPATEKVSGGQKKHTRNLTAWRQATIGRRPSRCGQKRHTHTLVCNECDGLMCHCAVRKDTHARLQRLPAAHAALRQPRL